MKKSFALLYVLLTVVCAFLYVPTSVAAKDDASFYGDGTTAAWEDISQYISPLYKNVPYINVSNGSVTKQFYFNTELFIDLGLYVYGEPASVQFSGAVNDFKAADYGYFRANGENSTKGEYRYLGYSINGIPMTNTRFPNEVSHDSSEMTLMRYTDLPEDLKITYNVQGANNAAYAYIRDLIEAADSPVWDFENFSNGVSITLRDKLQQLGLMTNGTPSLSIFDYAVIYSWAETGGSIRVFYQSKTNKEVISYATFTGPVSIDFSRKVPEFTSKIQVVKDHPNYIGNDTFYMKKGAANITLFLNISATLHDNYANLSDFGKQHSYTRDQVSGFFLLRKNKPIFDAVTQRNSNDITKVSSSQKNTIAESALQPGRNAITMSAKAQVMFQDRILMSNCSTTVYIFYDADEPQTPSPKPSASATPSPPPPTPSVSPAVSGSLPPAFPSATANFRLSRKW